MLDSTEIIEKIERLKRLDVERKIFGARVHGYQLNPCLNEEIVKAIEENYSICLPEEYRRFLLEVGNGGAGPYYGLFKLGEQDDGWGFCSWEKGYLLGDPSVTFRYQGRWNLPETIWSEAPVWEKMSAEEYSEAYKVWDAKVEELYWAPSVMDGAIPICHLGCALRQWLVVTGSEKGNIWGDDRVDNRGIYPILTKEGERVTFSEWYLNWLDESIHKVEQR